ncbi:hypothetical protein BGZ94_002292 [Podila epigama]|nr:hypothetical protein BGZ94_002292 [Podila epigama]
MKITPIAIGILSLTLSLACLGETAKKEEHHHHNHHQNQPAHHHHHNNKNNDKHPAQHHHHHHQNNKNIQHHSNKHSDHHHNKHPNQHHHHPQEGHRFKAKKLRKGKKGHHTQNHFDSAAIPSTPFAGQDDSNKKQQPQHEEPKVHPVEQPQKDKDIKDQKDSQDIHKQPQHELPPIHRQTEKMVVAYWTDWTASAMPPEAIPFDKVTHINYAFAVVRPDFRPVFETDYLLRRVVRAAHAKNTKVLLSIGGWTGSQYFSPLAATPHGRKTFIDGAVQLVREFHLDGIDIDWEYPARQGSACNIVDEKHDTANFLLLLQELRAALSALPDGNQLEISLATRIVPFDGPDGQQLRDVSAFAKVVNFINVMAYDINGSWGTVTGPNAPLSGQGLTYAGGAQAWIQAGFPPEQINMGVPFYGRSLIAKQDMSNSHTMASPFDAKVPIGDSNDGLWTDPCEKAAAYSGVWKFRNLREQGVIDGRGNARAPWIRKFDEETQTPWLFNPVTHQFVSYDDRESLKKKVDFAKDKNLGGVMLWAINQDTSDFELLEVLQDVRH